LRFNKLRKKEKINTTGPKLNLINLKQFFQVSSFVCDKYRYHAKYPWFCILYPAFTTEKRTAGVSKGG
jgi:hypothetical protein